MNQQSASVCLLWTPYIVEKQIGNVEFSFHFWEILFNCIMPRHTAIGCFLLTLSTFRPFNRLLHQKIMRSYLQIMIQKKENKTMQVFLFFWGGGGMWNHSSEIHRNTPKSNPSRNTHRNHLTCIFFHRICKVFNLAIPSSKPKLDTSHSPPSEAMVKPRSLWQIFDRRLLSVQRNKKRIAEVRPTVV